MSYQFHPAAEAEHLEAVGFYQSRSKGLGLEYLLDFEATRRRVVEAPGRLVIECQPDIRRASLSRFPYKVIYREQAAGVQVLALSHKRRRPDYWQHRV